MIDWLSGLTERYPGVANTPIILVLLCLCGFLVFSLIQLSPALPTLLPLVGLPLSDMRRFVGWQRLEFGPQEPFVNKQGQDVAKADYAIHVACGWRIFSPQGIVVGSDDHGPGSERHDEQGKPFFRMLAKTPPVVQKIKVDAVGSLHFVMTGGYWLDILSMGAVHGAQWIFLTPGVGTFMLDEQGFGS